MSVENVVILVDESGKQFRIPSEWTQFSETIQDFYSEYDGGVESGPCVIPLGRMTTHAATIIVERIFPVMAQYQSKRERKQEIYKQIKHCREFTIDELMNVSNYLSIGALTSVLADMITSRVAGKSPSAMRERFQFQDDQSIEKREEANNCWQKIRCITKSGWNRGASGNSSVQPRGISVRIPSVQTIVNSLSHPNIPPTTNNFMRVLE